MWPAPPTAASPWDCQARALAPRARVVREAPRAAPKPTPRPQPKAQPKTSSATPGMILGVAFVFDVWMKPLSPRGYEVKVLPGALDKFMSRLEAGKERVVLCFDHDRDIEFCSTDDGSLKIWINEDKELSFGVLPTTAKGRLAIGMVRAAPSHREASPCFRPLYGFKKEGRGNALPQMAYSEVTLEEISIVREGACPGVLVRVW